MGWNSIIQEVTTTALGLQPPSTWHQYQTLHSTVTTFLKLAVLSGKLHRLTRLFSVFRTRPDLWVSGINKLGQRMNTEFLICGPQFQQ